MRSLLQRMGHGFAPGPENHVDLAAWRAGTQLRYLGVELRLTHGSAEIRLRHLGADGAERDGSVHLVRTIPGSAFSPPLHLPDMGARLIPEVIDASADAQFELRVFTDDPPLLADPRPAYVLTATDREALRPTLEAFAAVPDAGRLVLVLSPNDTEAPSGPAIDILRAPVGPAWGVGMHTLAYASTLNSGATHIGLVEPGVQIPAATFERVRDLLRFARPGLHIGAALHTQDGPILGRNLDLATGMATAAHGAPSLAGGLIVVPRRAVYSVGLPMPGSDAFAAVDYPLRLRRVLGAPVVPVSLHVESVSLPDATPADGDHTGALMMTLRERGADRAVADEHLRQVAQDLHDGRLDQACQRLDAMDGLLSDGPLSADAPLRGVKNRLLLRWRRRRQARLLHDALPRLVRQAQARERDVTGVSAWDARLSGNRFVPGPATRAYDTQICALHSTICDQDIALRAALVAERRATDARLMAAGVGDPVRTRADLDRPNILAVAALRQRHAGRRAVVVGNGPSLRIADLDRLTGDITFASNKIFLAFDQTDWRPTYYSVEDHMVLENNRTRIEGLTGMVKIFPASMRDFHYHAPDTIFVPLIPPRSYTEPLSDPDFPAFSSELTQGIGWGSTVVYAQIQLAAYLGCTEIVVIGVDHSYELPARKVGNTYVSDGERNHFHPEYRAPGEVWHQPNIEVLEVSYAKARSACEARGIRIVNASRASRLDTFERADFDTLFPLTRPAS